MSYYHTRMYAFICIANIILQLTRVPQKLSFTVSTLLSWRLQWDRSDLGRVARDLFIKRFIPCKIFRKSWANFRSVCHGDHHKTPQIQDSPRQCQHIMYFIKDQIFVAHRILSIKAKAEPELPKSHSGREKASLLEEGKVRHHWISN